MPGSPMDYYSRQLSPAQRRASTPTQRTQRLLPARQRNLGRLGSRPTMAQLGHTSTTTFNRTPTGQPAPSRPQMLNPEEFVQSLNLPAAPASTPAPRAPVGPMAPAPQAEINQAAQQSVMGQVPRGDFYTPPLNPPPLNPNPNYGAAPALYAGTKPEPIVEWPRGLYNWFTMPGLESSGFGSAGILPNPATQRSEWDDTLTRQTSKPGFQRNDLPPEEVIRRLSGQPAQQAAQTPQASQQPAQNLPPLPGPAGAGTPLPGRMDPTLMLSGGVRPEQTTGYSPTSRMGVMGSGRMGATGMSIATQPEGAPGLNPAQSPEAFEANRRAGIVAQMGQTGSVPPNLLYEPWMGKNVGYNNLGEARQPGARYNYGFGNVPSEVPQARSVDDIVAQSQSRDANRFLNSNQRAQLATPQQPRHNFTVDGQPAPDENPFGTRADKNRRGVEGMRKIGLEPGRYEMNPRGTQVYVDPETGRASLVSGERANSVQGNDLGEYVDSVSSPLQRRMKSVGRRSKNLSRMKEKLESNRQAKADAYREKMKSPQQKFRESLLSDAKAKEQEEKDTAYQDKRVAQYNTLLGTILSQGNPPSYEEAQRQAWAGTDQLYPPRSGTAPYPATPIAGTAPPPAQSPPVAGQAPQTSNQLPEVSSRDAVEAATLLERDYPQIYESIKGKNPEEIDEWVANEYPSGLPDKAKDLVTKMKLGGLTERQRQEYQSSLNAPQSSGEMIPGTGQLGNLFGDMTWNSLGEFNRLANQSYNETQRDYDRWAREVEQWRNSTGDNVIVPQQTEGMMNRMLKKLMGVGTAKKIQPNLIRRNR